MTNSELNNLAGEVKKQNYGDSMKDLVYDPETGEFKQVPQGTGTGVVTEMTKEGFA